MVVGIRLGALGLRSEGLAGRRRRGALGRAAGGVLLAGAAAAVLEPEEITTAVLPGCIAAVLITAPAPVMTPQDKREALSKGMFSGIEAA